MARVGRAVMIVVGALAMLIGFALSAGGGTLLWANATQRDASGFFTTSRQQFVTSGSALTSSLDFGSNLGPSDFFLHHHLGTIRIKASVLEGADTFVGIASSASVDQYLTNVAHSRVTGVELFPFRAHYRNYGGSAVASVPVGNAMWSASSSGPGTRSITWPTEQGRWTVVVMRADARPGVAALVSVGAKAGWVQPLGIGLIVGGVLALIIGALLFVFGIIGLARRRAPRGELPSTAPPSLGEPPVRQLLSGAYPARLDGTLDSPLSRWLWIVKGFLAIPHFVVLAFLWMAMLPVTVVAGFSILFTGRYPRGVFDFSVGVLRWTWRVTFYTFGAFGTDRYPPFSLEPVTGYPADFSVDYPEHLSRGLVLVKWWLLAIPQYVVVGIFVGGWWGLTSNSHNSWVFSSGGGLVSLLVFVAVVILAFKGRYPAHLFDFIMGMNRWCYRVLAYALLMRDEYPPFRFDPGALDPGYAPLEAPPVETSSGEPLHS
jgi:hypothetical protein